MRLLTSGGGALTDNGHWTMQQVAVANDLHAAAGYIPTADRRGSGTDTSTELICVVCTF